MGLHVGCTIVSGSHAVGLARKYTDFWVGESQPFLCMQVGREAVVVPVAPQKPTDTKLEVLESQLAERGTDPVRHLRHYFGNFDIILGPFLARVPQTLYS